MNAERDRRLAAVLAEYLAARDAGAAPDRRALLAAHPDLGTELAAYLDDEERMERVAGGGHHATPRPMAAHRAPPRAAAAGAGALAPGELPVGSLLGPYRLLSVIGRGGMGTIYRARHVALGRTVAIKVLADALARDESLVQRFVREARALARLDHPNIVAIHDIGSQNDTHFFVMEHVEGVNLRHLMERGEMTPERALAIVPKVCVALEYAHDRGIVHRDIKPENILLDVQGEPKIADFGLAKVLQEESGLENLTRTDVVMGTYHYMAPEQKRSSAVDHRADIYALGVVLYEMLTGRLPEGSFVPPSQRADVDARLDEVVARALEAEPDQRYQRASDFGRDVTDIGRTPRPADGAPAPAAPPPRHIAVVDLDGGQPLGAGPAHWLRLVARHSGTLRVWGSPRADVALSRGKGKVSVRLTDEDGWGWFRPHTWLGLPPYGERNKRGWPGAFSASWLGHGKGWRTQWIGTDREADAALGEGDPEDGPSAAPATAEVRPVPGSAGSGPGADLAAGEVRCLELLLPKGDVSLQVPADLPLEIVAPHAELSVFGLRAALRIRGGDGEATIRDHVGALSVDRLSDGDLKVEGLESSDLHLTTREGALRVTALAFYAGRGLIQSEDGEVSVGVIVEKSRFGFEAQSLSASVVARLGTLEAGSDQLARGTLGTGGGSLRLVSASGDVRCLPHADLVRRTVLSEAGHELFWTAAVSGFFLWAGVHWIAVAVPVLWFTGSGWNLWKRVRASRG